MDKNSATNPVTEYIADSIEKRFESLESLRNVTEEVFNIDKAFFCAIIVRNTLHLSTCNGDIEFHNAEFQQLFFHHVEILQQSLLDYLKTKTKEFQEGVQQVIDLTDVLTDEIDILVSHVDKVRKSGEDKNL